VSVYQAHRDTFCDQETEKKGACMCAIDINF